MKEVGLLPSLEIGLVTASHHNPIHFFLGFLMVRFLQRNGRLRMSDGGGALQASHVFLQELYLLTKSLTLSINQVDRAAAG